MVGSGEMQTLSPQSGSPHHDASADSTEMGPQNSPAVQATVTGEILDGDRSKPPTTNRESEVQRSTQLSKRRKEDLRMRRILRPRIDENGHPKLVGVNVCPRKTYVANLWVPGVNIPGRKSRGIQICLGTYKTKEEAKAMHDRAALKLDEEYVADPQLNCPKDSYKEYMEEHATWDLRDFVWKFRHKAANFTKGVTHNLKKVAFEARISHKYKVPVQEMKTYELGTAFASEDEAAKAYDLALLFIHNKRSYWENLRLVTNFRPSTYSQDQIQEAGTRYGLRQVETPAQTEVQNNQDID